MSTSPGIFKRWIKGCPLCRIPFLHNLSIVFNILETASGISRPANGGDGYGWAFGGGSPGTLTEITIVTAVRIDGQYLQVKTRTGKVYDPGTESGWTTAYTAPAYDD